MSQLRHEGEVVQTVRSNWQTKARGSNDQEYEIYLSAVDENGLWLDGKPAKTYDEWLSS